MKKIRTLFMLVLLSATLSVQASDDVCFQKAQSQAQINECASAALKNADVDLNTLYRRMQDRLKDDAPTKALLTDAQRKWVSFRDAECNFTAVRSTGGSINSMQVNGCLTELTRTRVMELQNHLACGRGGGGQEASQCALPRDRR